MSSDATGRHHDRGDRQDGEHDTSARPRTGDLTLYATGSIGMGVWVTVPGLLLLYFLTRTLGVPALLAGTTLLLPKIVDVVVHPSSAP